MAERLRQAFENGAYNQVLGANELCMVITRDVQGLSNDKHLRMWWDPQASNRAIAGENPADYFLRDTQYDHFGFYRVERLKGNIGYVDLRFFVPATIAGDIAVAAMNFMALMKAVIFDLRRNGGG